MTHAAITAGDFFSALMPLIGVVVGALLTSAANAKRSNESKIWDLRRVTYGTILSNLAAIEAVLSNADDFIQQDEMRYFHDAAHQKNNAAMSNFMTRARRAYEDDYLILSDKFIGLFEAFLRVIDDYNPNLIPPEEHERFSTAVRAARPKLLRQARSEMPIARAKFGTKS